MYESRIAGSAARGPKRVIPISDAWRGGRKWVMFATDFMNDGKLILAGPSAELMFLRVVAQCGGQVSDGWLDEAYVLKMCGDLHGGAVDALAALVRVGVFEIIDGKVHVIKYLKHQKSAAQIHGSKAADRDRKAVSVAAMRASEAAAEEADSRSDRDAPPDPEADNGSDDNNVSTDHARAPKAGQAGFDPQADLACDYLADKVLEATGGQSRPTVTAKWRKDMRSVLDNAGGTKVAPVIDAAMADKWQRTQIHNPIALKNSWTKLLMLTGPKAAKASKGGPGPSTSTAAARPHKPRVAESAVA